MPDRLYFEDFHAGARAELGSHTPSVDEVVAFAREFDPQPMHLDDAAARATLLGGLAASGWHACALAQRLLVDGYVRRVAGLGSPGVAACRWRRPMRPDRAVSGRLEVQAVRPSNKRADLGYVELAIELEQGGEVACRLEGFRMMVATRAALGRPAPRPSAETALPATDAAAEHWPGAVGPEAMGWASAADIALGASIALGEETARADRLLAFARDFDPQPFHLDAEAARSSLFGDLSASGWQTVAWWMRRLLASMASAARTLPPERAAALAGLFGPSPGFRDLVWAKPVLVGDRLRYFIKAQTLTPHERLPGYAVLEMLNGCVNQRGELAMRFTGRVLVRT